MRELDRRGWRIGVVVVRSDPAEKSENRPLGPTTLHGAHLSKACGQIRPSLLNQHSGWASKWASRSQRANAGAPGPQSTCRWWGWVFLGFSVAGTRSRNDAWSARRHKGHQPRLQKEPPQNRFVVWSLAMTANPARNSPSAMNGSHTSSAPSTVSTTSALPRQGSV